jgi:hypothetical protein
MAALVTGVGAVTYSLPDVAINSTPGSTVTTPLTIGSSTGPAAMNIFVSYDGSVADPGAISAGSGFESFNIRSNVRPGAGPGGLDELRIVVWADATTEFTGLTVLDIQWTLDGSASAGASTALSFTGQDVDGNENLAVSDTAGNNLTGPVVMATVNRTNGLISVVDLPVIEDIVDGPLTDWEVFPVGGLPWPFNFFIGQPDDSVYPHLIVSDPGVVPISVRTSIQSDADGLMGFSSGQNFIDYTFGSVYVARFTFDAQVTAGTFDDGTIQVPIAHLPVLRCKVFDTAFNSATEIFIDGQSIAMPQAEVGGAFSAPVTIDVLFEPSDLRDNMGLVLPDGVPADKLYLEFDVFDIDPAAQGEFRLTGVDVTRLNKADVDPHFAVLDTTTDWQTDLLLGFRGFGRENPSIVSPELGLFSLDGITHAEQPGFLDATTGAIAGSSDSDPFDSLGFLQEFGTPVGQAVIGSPGRVFRQVVTAQTLDDGSDPRLTSELRLRMTDLVGRTAQNYFVFRHLDRDRGPATGVNRPALEPGTTTWTNYFTYPAEANVASVLGETVPFTIFDEFMNPLQVIAAPSDSLQALIGVIDFDEVGGTQAEGTIRFLENDMEAASRSIFGLP